MRQVREEGMSVLVQSPEDGPQHPREVAAEGPEDNSKLLSFLGQVLQQLKEGGQDPVVEASILSLDCQLSVPLQGTQAGTPSAEQSTEPEHNTRARTGAGTRTGSRTRTRPGLP